MLHLDGSCNHCYQDTPPSLPHTLKWSNITSVNPPKGNLNRKENLCLLYASYRQIDEELSHFIIIFGALGTREILKVLLAGLSGCAAES